MWRAEFPLLAFEIVTLFENTFFWIITFLLLCFRNRHWFSPFLCIMFKALALFPVQHSSHKSWQSKRHAKIKLGCFISSENKTQSLSSQRYNCGTFLLSCVSSFCFFVCWGAKRGNKQCPNQSNKPISLQTNMQIQPELAVITEPNTLPSLPLSQDITVQTRTCIRTHNKIKRLSLNHCRITEAVWHLFASVLHQLSLCVWIPGPTGADMTWHFHCYYSGR